VNEAASQPSAFTSSTKEQIRTQLVAGAGAVILLISLAAAFLPLANGLSKAAVIRLGNGCTSGHGVCGLARLSPRSVAATTTFMVAGIATLFVVRHVLGAG